MNEQEFHNYLDDLIAGKKDDDYSFDDNFNFAIDNKFYEAENSYVMFVALEENFNSIYQYYQYTKRYVRSYETIANDYYHSLAKDESDAVFEEFAPNGQLIDLNCESSLLMVYSAFEAFLRQFIEFIDEKAGVLKCPDDDLTTLKYLSFLHYDKNIFVPKTLYKDFNEIRLVRNYYAHSLDKIQFKLQKSLENDPYGIIQGPFIVVNDEYIDHVFDVLGKMVKAIEIAFEKSYPRLT